MRRLFYQANFCAECGNRFEKKRWWKHRYLCADCARQMGRRRYFAPVFFTICGLALGLAFSSGRRQTAIDRITLLGAAASPAVSAQDATTKLKTNRHAEPEQYSICGARTKRGTPCKHRTPPGQRCAQHRGQPSMIAEATGSITLTATPKTP